MGSRRSRHDIFGPVARRSRRPQLILDPDTNTILDANDAAADFYEAIDVSGVSTSLETLLDSESLDKLTDQIGPFDSEPLQKLTLRVTPTPDESHEITLRVESIEFEGQHCLHLSHLNQPEGQPSNSATDSESRLRNGAVVHSELDDNRDNGNHSRDRKYETLISNVPGIVYRCDYDSDWTMEFISDSIEDLTGYAPDEFIGNSVRSYASVIHPEDRKDVERDIRKEIENDEMFEVEYRIVDSEDRLHWVLERGQAIRNSDGEVRCLEGVILDITERKMAEKKLRKNEQRFRSVFENAEVGMAEISFDERWLSVNDRLEEILGYPEDELLEMKCREITHPDHIERDEKCTRKVMEGKSEYYVADKRYQHKNGEYVWVRMTVSRLDIPRGDHDGYFIAIIEDIDERKQYEQKLEQLVGEKETLVKEIHHRVKNNLQMMISLLDMQSRQASTTEAKNLLGESAGRIRSMALIHEMLYEKEKITEIDLENYVDSLTNYIHRARNIDGEDIELELNVEPVQLPIDRAIPSGLIMNELITNAFQHGSAEGTLSRITVDFSIEDERARLTVEDDGGGFPVSYDLESSDSLGLKIVRSLTEHELNGELSLGNENGARVDVRFDL